MKTQLLVLGTAMLFAVGTIFITGCGNTEQQENNHHEQAEGHDHGDGHSHDHSTVTEKADGNTAEFKGEKVKDLSLILDSYFQLTSALVNDNGNDAAKAGEKMLSAFNGFDKTSLEEDQVNEYSEIEESAVENAEHITRNASEIDHQREHLVALSEDINDLITLIGTDRKLYLDHCPMANNNKGANWISESKEISNPYMGSKMPKCGTLEKEIN